MSVLVLNASTIHVTHSTTKWKVIFSPFIGEEKHIERGGGGGGEEAKSPF